MLLRECIKELNVMYANGDKPEYTNRVKKLMHTVLEKIQGLAVLQKPQPPQTPFEPLRDYNFDAGQIKALQDLTIAVGAKQLPPGTAIAIASAAFPKIPPPLLNSMFTPLEAVQPVPPQNAPM
jgi:hypothetical protein